MYEENCSIHAIQNTPSMCSMKLNITAHDSIMGFS